MKAIFAVNALDGFGDGDTMPWPRNSLDLGRFREYTTGRTVIMGSGTWNSNMPKPLPNRRNIVLSKSLVDDRCEIYGNITHLLMNLAESEDVFVIGGARVLWSLRSYINEVYLTRFQSSQRSSVTLNTTEYLAGFDRVSSQDHGDHVFEIYRRT